MSRDQESLCVDPRIDPLLGELHHRVALHLTGWDGPERGELESFIARVFARTCGARVTNFFPTLLAFSQEHRLAGVVGVRSASGARLFLEHYLDVPAEQAVSACIARQVDRNEVVEVGNLALSAPGQARWIIAVTTAFLAAAGFHWVVFTAAAPLFNAFRRLGLRPIRVADADPERLPDRGTTWGRYYEAAPQVYAGDVRAGMGKLRYARCWQLDAPRHLLACAEALGARAFAPSLASGVAGT
ncbi:hypothetical protein KBTX_03017 [wastewater metagenome]|uniref:Thermostable hemolysin n=2 Tax=unclassified sequences TaxID=12908 RepID=A0A5B8RIS2_9ZZZZ|nr:thermostable hemolysin [Arhodomonas sp. KWT]QEA06677.1 hypothetical protein KBTEX_03017 [uncultured organism]